MKHMVKNIAHVFLIISIISGLFVENSVFAADPIRYQGRLQDGLGNYGQGSFDVRFSLWRNGMTQGGDVAAGVINGGAPDYLAWNEIHTVTIQEKDKGLFVVFLGDNVAFPFSLFNTEPNMFLQIDIKTSGSPDSSYEQIDASPKPALNRRLVDRSHYAENAGKVEDKSLGYNANEIPYLDGSGKLPESVIPNGVNENIFILDKNGDANANDTLSFQFGNILGKTLSWNGLLSRFEFNDTVAITGDILVSGTINSVSVGEKSKTVTLAPQYPHTIFIQDGTNNIGSMFEESILDGGSTYQVMQWTTSQASLQDYDIQIQYSLPDDFIRFEANNQIQLKYKTDGTNTDAVLNLTVEKDDEPGTDQINGTGALLSNNTFTTGIFTLEPTTVWDSNDALLIKIKMNASLNFNAEISNIEIKYIGS